MGSNWKISLLAVVLGLGLCFEVFKHLPMGQRLLKRDNGQTISSDPYALKSTRLQGGRLAVQSNRASARPLIIASTIPTQLIGTSEKDMNEEKSGAKDPTVALEKKKKKKKKKKKDKEDALETTEEEIAKKEPPKNEEAPERYAPATADTLTIKKNVAAAAAAAEDKDEPLSVEEWVKLLSEQPTQENIDKLKSAYDERNISAETYYKVAAALLENKNSTIQVAGVTVLGVTQSVASFLMLSDISKENRTDSLVRQRAELFISRYSTLSGLTVLHTVMHASDSAYATLKATQRVDAAIATYSKRKATTEQVTTKNSSAFYKRYFTPFVSVLTSLSTSQDQTLAQQAQDTLKDLQAFLEIQAPAATDADGLAAPAQAGL